MAEPFSVLDFSGLIYRRRYFVEDDTGMELENDTFRATKEHEVMRRLQGIQVTFTTPRISLEPAGNNVVAVVELGSTQLTPLEKDDLDAALDDAMDDIVGASKERADDVFPDLISWELQCR